MFDPQLRQLFNVLRGCIRGGDHARGLRLLIHNLSLSGGHHLLRSATARALEALDHKDEAAAIYELLARHLVHSGEPLLALCSALHVKRLTGQGDPQLDYLASLCAAGSPHLDDEGARPAPPPRQESIDLSGTTPADPLEALIARAVALATDPAGLAMTPDAIPPIPLLSHLPQPALREVFSLLRLETFVEGAVLLSPVDPPTAALWLASGAATARDDAGRARPVGVGALLGHQALLRHALPAPAFALVADTPIEALSLSPNAPLPAALRDLAARFDAACLLERAFQHSALFSALSPLDRHALQTQMRPCALDEPATLFAEGAPGDGLYILLDGQVLIARSGRTEHLGPGAVLGEISLVSDGPAVATVTTQGPARVLFLARDPALALLEQHPQLREQLSATAAIRLLGDDLVSSQRD
jgi:hypothetical protein